MSEDLSQLDRLPSIEEALKLPKQQFNDIAKSFYNYSSYCDNILKPEKVSDWCSYLGCGNGVCNYNFGTPALNVTTVTIDPVVLSIPKYCYDLWYCPAPSFSETHFYVLGILCFLICLVSLLMNIIYLPSFTFYGHRHGTDVLLTGMVFSDIFLHIFFIYLHCLPYVYRSHESQTLIYSKLIARTVPFFAPLLSLFHSLSSWLLCCLLFERYLYQQHGKHAQRIFTTKVSIVIIAILGSVLLIFTILKLFELESFSVDGTVYYVRLTDTGKMMTYHNIVTHFLKVPIEYFLPLLCFIVILGMMYTSFGEQGINSFQSSTEKRNRDLVKNFIIINEADRESRILHSIVILSTFASASIFLSFLHHVLSTEEDNNVTHMNLTYLDLACKIMSVVFNLIKPFLYAFISPSYCRGMRRYFIASFPEYDDGAPAMAMTFEQTIANQMRESISYRNSIWSSNIRVPTIILSKETNN